jgi:hypothetical protein
MSEESKTRDARLENAVQYYHGWYPNPDAPGPVASIARLFDVNRGTLTTGCAIEASLLLAMVV